jgi:NADPH-dependent 2,4-dienoyl-CoA reductase/sulfur reductase-like enzyme/nitrite reductase/ring-hydroxylating ferredoxin subunit
MAADQSEPTGPDLAAGVAAADLADGAMLLGHVGDEAVLLARRGGEVFAIGATCTHYGGPLAEGLLVDDTVRCPWHHACFSLRSGAAIRAPALNPVARWDVEQRDGRIRVLGTIAAPHVAAPASAPRRIGIIGGGAAATAAARMLRQEGYDGAITMVSADPSAPYDRPNLSKDYLAGTASEDWIPLYPPEFYADNRIELVLGTRVAAIDPAAKRVALAGGGSSEFDALLLATGAEPVRLNVPGADLPHVHLLRTLEDSRVIATAAQSARIAVVVGASFIGMEAAAALRSRGVAVRVVAPEARPMERVFGPELGSFLRRLHEQHGVAFHLGQQIASIDAHRVVLQNGDRLDADLVVVGVGVRPLTELAEHAGLPTDRGVIVDQYLQTSAAGIYAAGDLARWPDPHSGQAIRVEHWVVAERQGQTAARNMLGRRERFDAVPFFWTQQYDVGISYVGHADSWDAVELDGDMAAHDCAVRFKRAGRLLALATIYRDRASLEAELAMERAAAAPVAG